MPRTSKSQPAPSAEPKEGLPIKISVRASEGTEAKFVNHVTANFNGSEFVITLAQAIPPIQREGADWDAFLARGELEARVVIQVAMPPERFVEMTAAFADLVQRLRGRNLLPAGEESSR